MPLVRLNVSGVSHGPEENGTGLPGREFCNSQPRSDMSAIVMKAAVGFEPMSLPTSLGRFPYSVFCHRRPNGPKEPSPGPRPQADALGEGVFTAARPGGAPEITPLYGSGLMFFCPFRAKNLLIHGPRGIGLAASAPG